MLKFISAVKPRGNIRYGGLKEFVFLEIFTAFEKTLERLFENQRRQYFVIKRTCKKKKFQSSCNVYCIARIL